MRDVKKWAEAQLKKGYTKKHLKTFLTMRGYPSTAVAQVDKVKVDKKKKKVSMAVLIPSVIVVIIIAFFIFNSSKTPTQKDAEVIMKEFIQENLKEEYWQDSLDINRIEGGKPAYRATWTSDGITFSTVVTYYDNENPDLALSFHQPKITDIDITAFSLATSKFFRDVRFTEHNWKCIKGDSTEVCEISWLSQGDKKAVGIYNYENMDTSILYACKIPPGIEKYNQDSCISVR